MVFRQTESGVLLGAIKRWVGEAPNGEFSLADPASYSIIYTAAFSGSVGDYAAYRYDGFKEYVPEQEIIEYVRHAGHKLTHEEARRLFPDVDRAWDWRP